jgi:hypothetical protein
VFRSPLSFPSAARFDVSLAASFGASGVLPFIALLVIVLSTALPESVRGDETEVGDEPDANSEGEASWSWAPIVRPPIPDLLSSGETEWARTAIDHFIASKLRSRGLEPSPAADRRTLLRRLSFDLLGLPPSPSDVDRFVADDDPLAYERLVDRLLSDPRFGERQARHWLDVVHYGETHGYDKDKPRPNAWPYRDYVIRAFNEDKPWDRFVREQIAGDVIFPGTRDGVVATGFLAAGPWDFIGHEEVPESKIDGKIARHLDRDDIVTTVMNVFTSVTVQCAQCHDHKFDPVSQKEYYGLQAVFAAIDRSHRRFDETEELAARRSALARRESLASQSLARIEAAAFERASPQLAALDEEIARLRAGLERVENVAYGWHGPIAPSSESVVWVEVDLGRSFPIDGIRLAPCHDDFAGIGAGFGFPPRWKLEIADEVSGVRGPSRIVHDATSSPGTNPGIVPQLVPVSGETARYVRVTATQLAHRQSDYIVALAELIVSSNGENVARGARVDASGSIEAPPRWRRENLVDGIYPASRADPDSASRLETLTARRETTYREAIGSELAVQLESARAELAQLRRELAELPPEQLVYAGAVHHGGGAFRGTGPDGGRPREIRVLRRGDITRPGEIAPPRTIALFGDGSFSLDAAGGEGERRRALAEWIVDERNSLSWRSVVNRVWQYHFGVGIVDTPNDFGLMGGRPSHPELLDWLAAEFRDGKRSLKDLHRLIVLSAVYRQSSQDREGALELDGDNQLLWRMNRRRLEAEAIRDSVLAVSGSLVPRMYGAPFEEFIVEKPEHSPHYMYDKQDPSSPSQWRRSIYRFLVRSQQNPFMSSLDCADPSQIVERRQETITPLQALALLNNRFMLVMSERFAHRIESEAAPAGPIAAGAVTAGVPQRVRIAFRLALAREPRAEELEALADLANAHGLENVARVIFNLNEFAFVD